MFQRYALLFATALVLVAPLSAQQRTKIDLVLRAYLDGVHAADAQVDLFIHGSAAAVAQAVRTHGGVVKMSTGRITSARIPVARVEALAAEVAVERFEFSLDPGQVFNDTMRVRNRIDLVHAGQAPLPQAYDGTGVVVGIIDSGLDHTHGDFKDANGRTRIVKYWDQTLPFNAQLTPQPYGYGQVWDSTMINNGQMTSVDQPGLNGHGTTVTGTAAGNGLANGRHKGAAPGSSIIVVSSKFNSPNWRSVVADGVKYILDEAEAMGKPAVINASLGTYYGSHDGKDAAALLIDSMLTARGGRAMVCAIGNSNQFLPYHLRTEVTPDSAFTWFRYNPNLTFNGQQYGFVFFEVWADLADFANVQYAVGADRVTPSYQFRGSTPYRTIGANLGNVITDTLKNSSGQRLGVVQYYAAQRGDQIQLQVVMAQPDSNAYNFRFMTTGTGRYDVWSSLQIGNGCLMVTDIPPVATFPPIAKYVLPDRNKHLVDSWACSDKVVTVGNHYNVVSYIDVNGNPQTVPGTPGAITINSSLGPTRDERQKPDLTATGDVTFTANTADNLAILTALEPQKVAQGGLHSRAGGTSIASPVVTGAIALYFQKCTTAPVEEVIAALHGTAVADQFTGAVPNNIHGYGKLDAFALLNSSNLDNVALQAEDDQMCDNDPIDVLVPGDLATFEWSNGGDTNPLAYVGAGPLSVVAYNAAGCRTFSDTLTFTVLPAPAVPVITANGLELTSTPGDAYQWFYNGDPIEGANAQTFVAGSSGTYTVQIEAPNGCSAMSAPEQIIITGLAEGTTSATPALWPSPARDQITVQLPAGSGAVRLSVLDAGGKVVLQRTVNAVGTLQLPLTGLAPGTYALRLERGSERWQQRFVKLP